MMNDPHVEALIYHVEHNSDVDYDRAKPFKFDTSSFSVRIEKGEVRFELKEHYATEEAARAAVEPFVRSWELATGLDQGPGRFALVFRQADIVDRNPSPGVNIPVPLGRMVFTGHAPDLHLSYGRYPKPVLNLFVTQDVKRMYDRYKLYCEGRDLLGDTANFCLDVLVSGVKGKQRSAAAKKFRIDLDVLNNLGELAASKGGLYARKAKGMGEEFTAQEARWIDASLKAIIRRAAEVAYDSDQQLKQLTLADLPPLGTTKGRP